MYAEGSWVLSFSTLGPPSLHGDLLYSTQGASSSVSYLAREEALSEVGKKFGQRSEWKSERRDSLPDRSRLVQLHSAISPKTQLGACSQATTYLNCAGNEGNVQGNVVQKPTKLVMDNIPGRLVTHNHCLKLIDSFRELWSQFFSDSMT